MMRHGIVLDVVGVIAIVAVVALLGTLVRGQHPSRPRPCEGARWSVAPSAQLRRVCGRSAERRPEDAPASSELRMLRP